MVYVTPTSPTCEPWLLSILIPSIHIPPMSWMAPGGWEAETWLQRHFWRKKTLLLRSITLSSDNIFPSGFFLTTSAWSGTFGKMDFVCLWDTWGYLPSTFLGIAKVWNPPFTTYMQISHKSYTKSLYDYLIGKFHFCYTTKSRGGVTPSVPETNKTLKNGPFRSCGYVFKKSDEKYCLATKLWCFGKVFFQTPK